MATCLRKKMRAVVLNNTGKCATCSATRENLLPLSKATFTPVKKSKHIGGNSFSKGKEKLLKHRENGQEYRLPVIFR